MARPVLSPKFHGAWLGAVGGVNIGGLVVGLIESYITHKALPLPLIDLITTVTGAVVAAVGSYVAPLLAGLKTSELAALVSKPATAPAAAAPGGTGAPLI